MTTMGATRSASREASEVSDFLAAVEMARQRFLHGLEQVPDDRLGWTPGGLTRNALSLAGYFAGFLHSTARIFGDRVVPGREEPPPPPATRAAARQAVEDGFAALARAAGRLSAADLAQTAPAPWGAQIPLGRWLHVTGQVLGYFQGQINYLELAYGDADPHLPPNWGS